MNDLERLAAATNSRLVAPPQGNAPTPVAPPPPATDSYPASPTQPLRDSPWLWIKRGFFLGIGMSAWGFTLFLAWFLFVVLLLGGMASVLSHGFNH